MSWYNRKKFLSQPQVCERDKWSDSKICKLVCLYKKFPCLWKKDNPSYMDNSTRHSAYNNIYQGMDMPHVTFTEVMIKIREVRRIYVSELQKILKAHSSGRKYEPRQKWFFTLHNFLYEHLDFDETAELQGYEDSASSCYQENDDDEYDEADDFEYIDFDTPPRSDCNSSQSYGCSKNEKCRRIPQRISRHSSEASSSITDYSSPQKNTKHSPFLRIDSCPQRVNYCPIKVIQCPQYDSVPSSEVCQKFPQTKKTTSITVICEKKSQRDETNRDAEWKRSASIEKVTGNFQKEPSALSRPGSSSIEKIDTDGSLDASSWKTHDEFDVFAKSVACQLRKMDIESAVMAQNQIQNVLTDQRLHRNQSLRPVESETKNLLEDEKLPSSQESVTRVRSRVIKPTGSTSKRRLESVKPNLRKNEIRIVDRPARSMSQKRPPVPNQIMQRKTKKVLPK